MKFSIPTRARTTAVAAAVLATTTNTIHAVGDDLFTTLPAQGYGFTTFVAALEAADLVETLSGPGPFTVFAPTDEAFAALPAGLVPCLLLPENHDVLLELVLHHIADDRIELYPLRDVTDGTNVIPTRLEGHAVTVQVDNTGMYQGATALFGDVPQNPNQLFGDVQADVAMVLLQDVATTNGLMNYLDAVLVPSTIDVPAFLATCPDGVDASSGSSLNRRAATTTVAATIGAAVVAALLQIM